MRKYRKIRLFPNIYPKARAFARREYVEPYELDALNKGFYNGYVAGVKAMQRAMVRWQYGSRRAKELVDDVLGKGKLI